MASEVKLPELGEKLEGGEVLDVKVAVGDTVKEGQTLLEIEAEKSTVEVPSPLAGRISQLMVKKGDDVKVNQTLCLIEGTAGQKNGGPVTGPARTTERSAEPESRASRGREPPEAAARRAAAAGEEPQENARAVAQRLAPAPPPAREEAPKGDGRRTGPAPVPADKTGATTPGPAGVKALVPAGPATRRLARELGVDLRLVPGTARGGRVTQDDVKTYVRQLASGVVAPGPRGEAPPLPDFERWGPVERRPLEPVRRRTAEQMSLAWRLIPHVTQHDEADITDLDAFRRQQSGNGPKLTVTAFVLKAVAVALKQFEQFNASLDLSSGQLILKRYYHLGVAVDTGRGLLVPVLRDVDRKSIHELAQELTDVAERARNKKVAADEMRGATFTVTNLGGIGGTGFTPIINYPEVAILGLARARLQPVVRDGVVVPRLMLPLSLSYDHRVIDGADASRFARRIAEMLENPMVMLVYA